MLGLVFVLKFEKPNTTSKYPGPEGPALIAPKGLLFNSHWHVAEQAEPYFSHLAHRTRF
jgi:hypothetical protein